jgi:transcription elongation GreA/GreB family factor
MLFDYLLNHMLEIHRKKLSIVSAYKLDYDLYTEKLGFINAYIRAIEAFLETCQYNGEISELPFVVLNSITRLRSVNTGESLLMKIVLPGENGGESPEYPECVLHGCFSEWGHALLLKSAGERVCVGAPPETYVVENIAFIL